MSTDTPRFHSGGRGRSLVGLRFRFHKVAPNAYDVDSPTRPGHDMTGYEPLGRVGRCVGSSRWWAQTPDGTDRGDHFGTRSSAAASLSAAYREAADGPGGDPFAGLT